MPIPIYRIFLQFMVLVLASLLPLSVLAQAETDKKPGAYDADSALQISQAALGSSLQDLKFYDSQGRPVSLSKYQGRPLLISMIFTSCHHVCPTTTKRLADAVRAAKDVLGGDSFNVVTVGFDTVNDTPEAMQSFARQQSVKDENWEFLSADFETIEALATDLGFVYFRTARGFDHITQVSVIDRDATIYRQVYGITFPTPQLIEPLKELVFGHPKEQSSLSYLGNRIRLFCTVYDPATDSYRIDVSVFIGTIVGIITSLVFGRMLFKEWRKSIKAGR